MSNLEAAVDRAAGEKAIREMARMLVAKGVTPEEIGRVRRLSGWQTVTKDADGEAHLHDLYGFQLAPSWDDGPAWQPVDRGPAVKVAAARRGLVPSSDQVAVILPDVQAGYFRNAAVELEPIHDTAAIDAAIAVVAAARPTVIVLLGDNLDGAELGRYRLSPAFAATTQATIDYLGALMARLRAAAPEARIVWLAGNHEERLANYLLDNARAAFGLRQANPTPSDWPVLSIPHLCRLDDHGVEYLPGYPASEVWITPTLRCIHGNKVRSKGSTAHAYLPEARTSVIYGHVHRIEQAWATRTDHDGPVSVMAASPGCLARVDGVVPSAGQGVDLDGRPLLRPEDWQQGCAVVTVHDDESFDYEQVRIVDGVARWRGSEYR